MNKENPAISILIPVYNAEVYLRQCLNSVVSQTIESKEVIILDDGSVDSTLDICNEYAKKFEFIKVIHQENEGVVKARCRLLSIAQGDYIGWIDSDDYAEPNMFEELYSAAIREKADIAMCDYSFFPKSINTKVKWYKPYQGVVDWRFIDRNTQQWNKIVKREFLEKINLESMMKECGEGAYAFVLIFAKGIISINKQLYHYRVGHNSLSANLQNVNYFKTNVGKAKKRVKLAGKLNLQSDMQTYFKYCLIYAQLQLIIVAANRCQRKVYRKEVLEYKRMNPNKNPYTKKVLDNSYGRLRSYVMRRIIPCNYYIASFIVGIALH